jgi:hypothetical protein
VISDDAVDTAIGTWLVLWQAAKRKHGPFLEFEPIPAGERYRIISVLWSPKQPVSLFDRWPECLREARLDNVNRKVCDIDPDPITAELFGRLDRGAATAEGVEDRIALFGGGLNDAF